MKTLDNKAVFNDPGRCCDEGMTPHGTKYVTYFKDKDGKPCTEEDAYEYHIHEYDPEGNWLGETIAFSNKS